jgi:hypothetical protein
MDKDLNLRRLNQDINIRYKIPAYLATIFQNIKSGTENTDKQNEYKYTK